MTNRQKQKSICYKKLEAYHRELTDDGKAHLWHQVNALGLNELEVMSDIISSHQDLLKSGFWRRIK